MSLLEGELWEHYQRRFEELMKLTREKLQERVQELTSDLIGIRIDATMFFKMPKRSYVNFILAYSFAELRLLRSIQPQDLPTLINHKWLDETSKDHYAKTMEACYADQHQQ